MSPDMSKLQTDEAVTRVPTNRIQIADEAVHRVPSTSTGVYDMKRQQSMSEMEVGYGDADARDTTRKQVSYFCWSLFLLEHECGS